MKNLVLIPILLISILSTFSQEFIINGSPYENADYITKSRKSFLRERWFYEQRMFPKNYLPENCYSNAIKQRDLLRSQNGFAMGVDFVWRNIGPNPAVYFNYSSVSGRVTSVKYDPVNPNIIYIGGACGGLWRSTNGGNNFYPIADRVASLSTGSICIDPNNTNTIYYGTGEATYSGSSYYGSGLMKSTDNGNTWINYTSGLPSLSYFSRLVLKPGSSNFLFAAMGTSGLYWSTNGGQNWSLHVTGRCDDVVFSPNGTTGYAVGSGSGFRKSTDGGVSFLPASGGPVMGMRNHIAICRDNPSVLYISTYDNSVIKVYKSTNSGANFTQVTIGQDFNGVQAWYDFYMHVNPFDANYAYVGSIDIFRTTNGGSSFINITRSYENGSVHADQHNMDFNPLNPNELVAVNDGGVWKSTNKGTNWINLNAGLSLTQFYRLTSNPQDFTHLIGGTQDNGTQMTRNLTSWNAVFEADGGEVCFHSQNNMYILGETQYNNIMASSNGGNNWVSSTAGLSGNSAWVGPIISHPTQPGVFYTAREQVFKSTNWGFNWQPISSGTSGIISCLAISKTNPEVIYAASGSFIFKSTNSGSSFASVTSGLVYKTITSVNIHPDSSNVVLLTYSGFGAGKVYKTSNGGSTWNNISSNLPDSPVNDLLIYYPGVATGIYYLAMDVGVFYTNSFGNTWNELADSLPNTVVMNIDYNQASDMVRIATHGRGVWETGTPIGIINYSNEIPAAYSLYQNYPNPFNPTTLFKYDIVKKGFVKLAVYDILGRELKTIFEGIQSPGKYTAQFNAGSLASGVYFYRLVTNDFTETRKMILTK